MAAGLIPKHIEEFPLSELTPKHFLVIANEAAKQSEWEINYISAKGLIAYTTNGMFSWNAEIKIIIDGGKAIIKSSSTGNDVIDWGKNKRNVQNFLQSFEQIKKKLTPEEVDLKYTELAEKLVPPEEDILKDPQPTNGEQVKDFLSIFKPVRGFFVTPVLLNINILIYVLMVFSGVSFIAPDGESLLGWGANFRPATLSGEWWRLITCCFIHIGIIHLLMNMYALLYIGVLLEPILGSIRFASAYILAGVSASVVSLWWHDFTVSAGASGAIFGMYGVFVALLSSDLIEKTSRRSMLTSIGVFIGYNLIYGLQGSIDNAAHIGGLLSGIIIGAVMLPGVKKPESKSLENITIAVCAVVVLTVSFIAMAVIPNNIGIYEKKMEEFQQYETQALEIHNLPKNTPDTKIVEFIDNVAIQKWENCKRIVNELNAIELPEHLYNRNRLLLRYCNLRIKSYQTISKAILENTDRYKSNIDSCNAEINAVLEDLSRS